MTVFIEKVYKTQSADFLSRIKKYLYDTCSGKKLRFIIYAREDWPDKHETIPELTEKGIQEVKISVGKFFMGKYSIQRVVTELKKGYGAQLKVTQPGHLHEDRMNGARSSTGSKDVLLDRTRSLFLIVDRQIGDNPRFPADTKFFICYEQQVINCNPCHVFDEDKPAWIDHTTIPHTLMGAMINVTRPWWPKDSKSPIRLCDPFVGSGTTWLEALKYSQVKPFCSDRHPMASSLANENLNFFAKSREELIKLMNDLSQLKDSSPTLRRKSTFERAKDFYFKCSRRKNRSGGMLLADPELIRIFNASDELFRYAFYLILKVERRSSGLEINDAQWSTLFTKEIEKQTRAIHYLLDKNKMGVYEHDDSRLEIGQGGYSRAIKVNYRFIKNLNNSARGTCLGQREVKDLQKRSVDVIVTDPPYGFNTDEDPTYLANTYAEMIPSLVNALRDDGQLVLALPDWSHSGRQILAFTYKEFVTNQVILAADQRGWEVIRSAAPATRERDLFRAPFYWESERALRRAILHFRFRKKSRSPGKRALKFDNDEARE
jgi:site-specific DNA-adenine methylase